MFSVSTDGRTRSNGLNLSQGSFGLDIRKILSNSQGSEALEQVAKGGRGIPSSEAFKNRSDKLLSGMG